MRTLLAPKGACVAIGPEKGVLWRDGVSRLVSPHDSHRYLLRRDGVAVSVLQIVARTDDVGLIANAYTLPEHRRAGLARSLMEAARRDFATIVHSDHLSPDGAAWASAVEQDRP